MQPSIQNFPRPPRSPSLRSHRTLSNTSIEDDEMSLSSTMSGLSRRGNNLPKISTSDFSAVRGAVTGISRMKKGRRGTKTSVVPDLINPPVDNPRGGRRASNIYSLSELAVAGATVKRRKRSTLETWGRRSTIGVTKYFDKNLPPEELFRRCVRLVQMFASLCQYKYEKENEGQEATAHTVFTEYINDEENKIDGGLAFDASFFKANRKMRISQEVKNILLAPPEQRNEQQLAKVLFSLRSIRAFAEYPQRIQNKLITVGWFESHSSKRAILRQGHIPQAFYFVLSGSAVVTIMTENEPFARTVAFLRRGDSFGELAILHDTRRQSTVISREPIELLVISREDFVDIFMLAGGMKNLNDPDHQKFIRGIEFLKGWPTELMAKNPKQCLFHFFRSGSVLVKDSNHTDWIYIIKWGSCRILKKLKEVKSQLIEHKERVVGFDNVRSLVPKADSRSKIDRVRAKMAVVTMLLPKLTLKSLTEVSEETDDDYHRVNPNRDEGAYIEQVAAAQGILARFRKKRSLKPDEEIEIGNLSGKSSRLSSPVFSSPRPATPTDGTKTSNKKLSFNIEDKETEDDEVKSKTPNKSSRRGSRRRSSLTPTSTILKQRPKKSPKTTNASNLMQTDKEDEEADIPRQKISVIDEEAQRQKNVEITEADRHPMFVQIALLSKGDVFGVSSMLFDDQPSLSLVSNGAECIMISKKFYLSHCTDAMKRRLMTTETPFPDEEALQKSLQDKVNWDAYRRKTLQGIVKNSSLRRQFYNRQNHKYNDNKIDSDICEELKILLKHLQETGS